MTWKPLLFLPGRSPAGSRAARTDPSPRRDEEGGRGLCRCDAGWGLPRTHRFHPRSAPRWLRERRGGVPGGARLKPSAGRSRSLPSPPTSGLMGKGGTHRSQWEMQSGSGGRAVGRGHAPPPHHHHHPLPPHGAEAGGEGGGWLGGCALTLHLVTFNERGLLCTKRALGGCITHGYGEGISTAPTWGGAPGTR